MDWGERSRELLPIVGLIFISTLFLVPYLQHPELGYDTPQHISKGVYLSKHLPYVGWHPEWHFGRPFLLTYPPLTYYVISLFSLFLPDLTAYSAVVLLVVMLNPITIYLLLREWELDKIVAFASALLLLTSWTYLGTIYVRGELPYMLGCTFVLLFFLSLERTNSLRGEIISGMILAAVFCTHQQATQMWAVLLVPYILINPKKIPYGELIRSLRAVVVVGVGLSSLFLVPFIISMLSNEFSLGVGGVPSAAISIKKLFVAPSYFYNYYSFIGYPIILLMFVTIYSISAHPAKCRQNRRLILSGTWSGLFFLMGAYNMTPLPTIRHFFFIAVSLSLFSAYGLKFIHDKKNELMYVLMIGFLVFGYMGTSKMVRHTPFSALDDNTKEVAYYLQSVVYSDEMVLIKDSFISYWFNTYSDISQTGGGAVNGMLNRDLFWIFSRANYNETKELMKELGIRYVVVSSKHSKNYLELGFTDVFHTPSTNILLLNSIEPNFVVGKNLIVKSVTYDDPDYIYIEFNGLEKDKELVVRTSYHRGWKAYLDGERIPVQKSVHGFIELYPDSVGEHRIDLKYSLIERKIGFLMTYLSLVVIMVYYVLKTREEGSYKHER